MVNLMNKKVLAIVEGEKKEPQLLNRLFDTYMYRKREIVSYGANIYDLYNKLLDFYGEDWEDLDFLLFLREQEKDDGKKTIFDEVYTDIFLVFDFDPQDNRFSTKAIGRMMNYFNDSTSCGRLYINYPMVESCIHITSFDDMSYLSSKVRKDELSNYKKIANEESCCPNITQYNKMTFSQIIRLNLWKIIYMLNIDKDNLSGDLYGILREVLKLQVALWQRESSIYILNTCLLCIYEYNPKMIQWLDRR